MNLINEDSYKRYSVWVYKSEDNVLVYDNEMPNTEEIWFEFYNFSYVTWKLMEKECIESIDDFLGKIYVYNFMKLKRFFLKRMIRDTNVCEYLIKDNDDVLTEHSYQQIIRLYPRIIRCILNKVNLFDESFNEDETKRIAKETALLFGKNSGGVANPHPYITLYCDLMSFWDKFGLNYFDIQKLPHNVFYGLKYIMNIDSDFKNREMSTPPPSKGNPMNRCGMHKTIRF